MTTQRSSTRRTLAGLVATTLALTGFFIAPAHAADANDPINVALASDEHAPDVAVSYVPGWNAATALNDGRNAPTDDLGAMWGTWGADPTPDVDTATYTWDTPVTVSSSTVYLWQNYGVGDGGVMLPSAWSVEYQTTAGDWAPVTGSDLTYPVPALDTESPKTSQAPVTATFDTVTTQAVRLILTRQTFQDIKRATSVIEWEVTGTFAPTTPPIDPSDGFIDAENVAVRTLTGVAPSLPPAVWVIDKDGPLHYVDAKWDEIPATSYAKPGTVTVQGKAKGYDGQNLTADINVVDVLSTEITGIDYASVITTPRVAPVLPRTVRVSYPDGTIDSTIPVVWDAIAPTSYATAEAVFDVPGTVTGTDQKARATVFVIAPINQTSPLVTVELDASPAGTGWYLTTPKAVVTVQKTAADIATTEVSFDGGTTWAPYTEPLTVTGEGEITVQARATATDGEVGTGSATARIDTQAPITTEHIDVKDGTSATVTLTATDGDKGSGPVRTVWSDGPDADPTSAANNMYATYEKPFSVQLTKEPRYIHIHTQDAAGNEEETRTITLPSATTPGTPSPSPSSSAPTQSWPNETGNPTPSASPSQDGKLSATGMNDVWPGVIAAMVLLALGAFTLVARRRRTRP